MSQNFNKVYQFVLTADGSPQRQPCTFTYIMCRTADQDFEMSFDGQSWFPVGQGEAFGPFAAGAESEFFVRATAGVDTTIGIRCSSMVAANNRLNLIHNDAAVLNVGAKLPPTYIVPFSVVLDAAGGANPTKTIVGVNAGNQRSYIHILNRDVVSLALQTAANVTFAAIDAGGDLPIETNDTIKLANQNAQPLAVIGYEVYYSA